VRRDGGPGVSRTGPAIAIIGNDQRKQNRRLDLVAYQRHQLAGRRGGMGVMLVIAVAFFEIIWYASTRA